MPISVETIPNFKLYGIETAIYLNILIKILSDIEKLHKQYKFSFHSRNGMKCISIYKLTHIHIRHAEIK